MQVESFPQSPIAHTAFFPEVAHPESMEFRKVLEQHFIALLVKRVVFLNMRRMESFFEVFVVASLFFLKQET